MRARSGGDVVAGHGSLERLPHGGAIRRRYPRLVDLEENALLGADVALQQLGVTSERLGRTVERGSRGSELVMLHEQAIDQIVPGIHERPKQREEDLFLGSEMRREVAREEGSGDRRLMVESRRGAQGLTQEEDAQQTLVMLTRQGHQAGIAFEWRHGWFERRPVGPLGRRKLTDARRGGTRIAPRRGRWHG